MTHAARTPAQALRSTTPAIAAIPRWGGQPVRGFTLIELLVVLAIIATLLTIAVPRYFGSLENSKETTLKQSLAVMRDAIDKHMGDTGRYPASLEELVSKRYLRAVPVDPITERSDTWQAVTATDAAPVTGVTMGGMRDVHSGATGNGRDGTPYASW